MESRGAWRTDRAEVRTLLAAFCVPEFRLLRGLFAVPRVFYGFAALQTFAGVLTQMGRNRAVIVTDKGVRQHGVAVERFLKKVGVETQLIDDALPEVPVASLKPIVNKMNSFNPNIIVGVGGGSVLDTAKVTWILYESPGVDITDISIYSPLGLRKKALLACIPTTAGTGSEVSSGAMVLDDSIKPPRKQVIGHPQLLPDFAVLDPRFVVKLPRNLTLGTALDALSHAVDCYLCRSSGDISHAFALRAVKMIFKYLPLSLDKPQNLQIRLKMQIAAMMAGVAMSNGGLAATHALAHSIGSVFQIHHGMACGVTIPYVIKFYADVDDKYIELAEELGIRNNKKTLERLLSMFVGFYKNIGAPMTLKDLGIKDDDLVRNLDLLADYAVRDPALPSPRHVTFDDAKKLILDMYHGRL